MVDLNGAVALVTGAGSGVGQATSLLLARHGVTVGLLGRTSARLESVADEIAGIGGRRFVLPADVADGSAVDAAVERLTREAGRLDSLIYCAGIGLYGPVQSYPLADWDRTLATNVTGLFLCARAALPHLSMSGRGRIIAIASGAGRRGYADRAAYSASKFAMIGFMESLAEEVGDQGIKCSTVLPGSITTDFAGTTADQKRSSDRKFLEPEDVADAILYLLQQPDHAWTQEMNLWPY